MICTKCNREAVQDAKFCPFCGRQLVRRRKPRHNPNGAGTAYQRPGQKTWTAEIVVGWRDLPPLDIGDTKENMKQRIPIKRTKGGFKTRADALLG